MHAILAALWVGVSLGLMWGVKQPWAVAVGLLPPLIWLQVSLWRRHLRAVGGKRVGAAQKKESRSRARALAKASRSVMGNRRPLLPAGVFWRFRRQLVQAQKKPILAGQQPAHRPQEQRNLSATTKVTTTQATRGNLPKAAAPEMKENPPQPVTMTATTKQASSPQTAMDAHKPTTTQDATAKQNQPHKAPPQVKKAAASAGSLQAAKHPAETGKAVKEEASPSVAASKKTVAETASAMKLRKTRRKLASLGHMNESQDLLELFDDLRFVGGESKGMLEKLKNPQLHGSKTHKTNQVDYLHTPINKATETITSKNSDKKTHKPTDKEATAAKMPVAPANTKTIPPTPTSDNDLHKTTRKAAQPPDKTPKQISVKTPAVSLALGSAMKAYHNSDWQGVRSGLEQHLKDSSHTDAATLRLQALLALHDTHPEAAAHHLQAWLKLAPLTVEELQDLWQALPKTASQKLQRLAKKCTLESFIQHAKKHQNHDKLQQAYSLMTSLLHDWGEELALIECLRQQLQLRERLGDIAGQLELIDRLGNRYYKLNKTNEAKACYKAGLKLKSQLESPHP